MSELSLQSIDTLLKSKNYILGNDQLRGNDRAINYFCGSNRNEADQIQIFKYPHSFNMVSYITTDIEYSRKLKIDIFNKGFVYYRTIKDTNYTIGCYRKGKFIVGLSQYSIGNIWHYSNSIQKEN